LTSLPALPSQLQYLRTSLSSLTALPSLPSGLVNLECYFNALTALPALPSLLQILTCYENQLTILPTLPNSLTHLYCHNNLITSLPALPNALYELDCSFNQLTNLPVLPNSLVYLTCNNNLITSLPVLPTSLSKLYCSVNQLTILPALPGTLDEIHCHNNQLTSLPELPDTLYSLIIGNNPISCLPELKKINSFNWQNTSIQCLPNVGNITNSNPLIDTVPLCDPFSLCPLYWNISGEIFNDADSNCTAGIGEQFLSGIPVHLDSAGAQLQMMYTDSYGRYSFETGFGTYNLNIDTSNVPYRVVCPVSFNSTVLLDAIDSMDTGVDFGLLCNPGFDLIARSVSPVNFFRIGFPTELLLNAGDGMSFSGVSCASGINGTVELILSPLASYVSPAVGAITPSAINGDTITWNVTDFSLVDPVHDFNIILQVSALATISDSICIQLNVTPSADNIPANNFISECFPVRAAFDPNEKYMSPSGLVDTSQHWFTFTIFFQNVGNAPAENIYILDTLDHNLDATTFTYLYSSHDVVTQLLPGNILRFNYPQIQLPDSFANEPASHGYVKYKVRRNDNLPFNTTIYNTAHIFFDFNSAIVTNTVEATLIDEVLIAENVSDDIRIYPNPVINQLTVYSKQYAITSIEIINPLGQPFMFRTYETSKDALIDVSGLQPGLYFLLLKNDSKTMVKRFVKH
jgi:uncharacterized repeat protein (TIGR01451 family)